jgi:hypothetical protein
MKGLNVMNNLESKIAKYVNKNTNFIRFEYKVKTLEGYTYTLDNYTIKYDKDKLNLEGFYNHCIEVVNNDLKDILEELEEKEMILLPLEGRILRSNEIKEIWLDANSNKYEDMIDWENN